MSNVTQIITPAITIEVKTVYGVTKAYPVCSRAKLFAEIAGNKTLTLATLNRIRALGHDIISLANADWSQAA